MKITNQLLREIDDLGNKELFRAYHPAHMEERHIYIDDNGLRQRLKNIPFTENELCLFSRFYGKTEKVLPMIQKCIRQNIGALEKWDPYQTALVLHADFPEPIGTGLVKGTDWNVPFPMSRIRVVLENADIRGRLFKVVTAYPVPDMDEIDDIWDAIDTFSIEQRRRHREKDA